MDRIREAFEALNAPYYRTAPVISKGNKCGPNHWQQHHPKARDASRHAAKGDMKYTSTWDRWQNDEWSLSSISTCTQLDRWMGKNSETSSCTSIPAIMHRRGKKHNITVWFICEASTRTSKRDPHGSDLDLKKQPELLRIFRMLKAKECL